MLRMAGIKWQCFTAGPHEGKGRTEIFVQGCPKAHHGKPCEGCFNEETWDMNGPARELDAIELARLLNYQLPNNLLTIGGGEPFAQGKELAQMLLALRQLRSNLHVIIYSGYTIKQLLNDDVIGIFTRSQSRALLRLVDVLVDGSFDYKKNTWNPKNGYIGSSNQRIYDLKKIAKLLKK
jgi:organic radical activating enzyme